MATLSGCPLASLLVSPREDPPNGERQVDGIEHCPAEQTRRDLEREPGNVPDRPQVEVQDVLPDIQHSSCEVATLPVGHRLDL